MSSAPAVVGVVMGSSSDWETLRAATEILAEFGIAHEARVVSAHRMPDEMFAYAEAAAARGLRAIIAGAGGAAHLPGMLAAKTTVPVLGVPVESRHLQGPRLALLDRPDAARASRSRPSRSAAPAPPTRRCSPSRCSPPATPALRDRLEAYRARQTDAARAMSAELK